MATVTVTRPTRYLEWPKKALNGLMTRNPTMDVAMKSVFSLDLTRQRGAQPKSRSLAAMSMWAMRLSFAWITW